jgi:hypothetical protein
VESRFNRLAVGSVGEVGLMRKSSARQPSSFLSPDLTRAESFGESAGPLRSRHTIRAQMRV